MSFSPVLAVLLLPCVLVPATVAVQLLGVTVLGRSLKRQAWGGFARMLAVVAGLMATHAAQIALYAAAYAAAHGGFGVRGFDPPVAGFGDYLYFSMQTFTSVGYGDIYPLLAMRLLAAAESLNGLLLLGWSISLILHVRLGVVPR